MSQTSIPELPTPEQIAHWQAEAQLRWPDYKLKLEFRQTTDGIEYSLWLAPWLTAPCSQITPLLPTKPNWQPLELFWNEGRSHLEFLFSQFPEQASLILPQNTLHRHHRVQSLRRLVLLLAAPIVATELVFLGIPLLQIRFVPIPGITRSVQSKPIDLSRITPIEISVDCTSAGGGGSTTQTNTRTWQIKGQRISITEPVSTQSR